VMATFCAWVFVNRALKYLVACVCRSVADRFAAFFDSISAVESSAAWNCVLVALARLKSTATPTPPISGMAVKASIGAMLPRWSRKKRANLSNMGGPGLFKRHGVHQVPDYGGDVLPPHVRDDAKLGKNRRELSKKMGCRRLGDCERAGDGYLTSCRPAGAELPRPSLTCSRRGWTRVNRGLEWPSRGR